MRRLTLALAFLALALLLAGGALLLLAPGTGSLRPHPLPLASYDAAVAAVRAAQAGEGARIGPAGRTLLFIHGRRTRRVYLLFHGLTNGPRQFESLGRRLYAGGANVLIPRLPHHGLADRMTAELAGLTAPELVAFADHQVDIAAALGDSVTVSGLSLGGTLACWTAQTRPEVSRAVPLAPLLGLGSMPPAASALLRNGFPLVPNAFVWWDPRLGEHLPGPHYVYPRYATRALGEILRLALAVDLRARHAAPAARSILFVINDNDHAVSAAAAAALARRWHHAGATRIETLRFARDLALGHDFVDPAQPYQRVAFVHPVLARALGDSLAGALPGGVTLQR